MNQLQFLTDLSNWIPQNHISRIVNEVVENIANDENDEIDSIDEMKDLSEISSNILKSLEEKNTKYKKSTISSEQIINIF